MSTQLESFGAVLRDLAGKYYGSASGLARSLYLTDGRVSQLVTGKAGTVTPRTLESLLQAFSDYEDKMKLYLAWQREFAPTPAEVSLGLDAPEEDVLRYLDSVDELVQLGQFRPVIQALSTCAGDFQGNTDRWELSMQAGRKLVETYLFIDRRQRAADIAVRMADSAKQRSAPAFIAMSIWLEAVALRPLSPIKQLESGSATRRLAEYLESWQPQTDRERSQNRDLVNAFCRDSVLLWWDAMHFRREQALERLESALAMLERQQDTFRSEREHLLSKEVEARARIAVGDLDGAYLAMEHLERSEIPTLDAMYVKAELTKVRLLLAEREFDEAERRLDGCMSVTEDRGLIHYHNEGKMLERELMGLWSSKARHT